MNCINKVAMCSTALRQLTESRLWSTINFLSATSQVMLKRIDSERRRMSNQVRYFDSLLIEGRLTP